ncbi:MAG: twin-arginine translocase TatA/TatE family subunit, partial [Opitutales bacterium]|nr:twin-arginine translocase TatA/TatE family subunit [Opitutales bacterium]
MSAAIYSLAFANIGPWQIILIVFIVLLLFGAKRLPDLFRGLGQG